MSRHVAEQPLAELPDGPIRLAHMINAYNALSMFNVLESAIPTTHAGLAKIRFFALRQLPIGGQTMSLYRFENEVIRPDTRARNDPRVHFALNCSAVGCPVLPRRPFTAAALDAELERRDAGLFRPPAKLPHRRCRPNRVAQRAARFLSRRILFPARRPACWPTPTGMRRSRHRPTTRSVSRPTTGPSAIAGGGTERGVDRESSTAALLAAGGASATAAPTGSPDDCSQAATEERQQDFWRPQAPSCLCRSTNLNDAVNGTARATH